MSAIKLLLSLIHPLEIIKGFTLWGGGGGGGSTSGGTNTNITELPEWARGYAKDTLAKTAALTDTNQNPYQTYNQDRIAGFSPLQQQSQNAAANMQTNQGTGMGMNIAGAAALGGLNQNYNGMQARTQNFGDRSANQYMSPYIQQALAPQMQQIARTGDQQKVANAGQATQAGAFGGSRFGIQNAMTDYNTQQAQSQAYGTGMQNAYNNATQQFNADQARQLQAQGMNQNQQQFGANLGLQGLNTALQGANQLGALGQQQFQQGMDINKLQNAYGGQQQALQQQGLDTAYSDFLNQQNYPYKQLGFMSDMIRGLPVGQQSTQQIYTPNPTTAQNITALGAGAYGLSKFMAEGGLAYADGGSVESQGNVESIVSKLPDAQLQQALKAAQARGDVDEIEAVQNELGMRASLRHGIAGGVTPGMVQKMAGGGGVLAFAGDDEENGPAGQLTVSPGNQAYYSQAGQFAMEGLDKLRKREALKGMTKSERAAAEQEAYERAQKFGGPDPYAPMNQKLSQFEADRAKNYERGLGYAALQSIPKILQGANAVRGIGAGVGEFGSQAEQLDKADSAEKRALAGLQFNLADAQRKERLGLGKEAMANVKDVEANRIAIDAAERKGITDEISGASNLAKAYRPVGGAGAGGAGNKEWTYASKTYLPLAKKAHPNASPEELNAYAYQMYQNNKSAGLPGATDRNETTRLVAAGNAWGKMNDLKQKEWARGAGVNVDQPGWQTEAQDKFTKTYTPTVTTLARGGTIEPIKLD